MLESRRGRLVGVVLLVAVLGGLCVGFGTQTSVQTHASLPDTDHLGYDAGRYVGERVEVSGVVINTDPVVIGAEYNYYDAGERHGDFLTLTVRGVDRPLEEGAVVQVYGVLESENAIAARNIVVVPARNYLYMYVVSFLAGLWVLGRLLAHWRLDPTSFALVKRATPIRAREFVQPGESRGEES